MNADKWVFPKLANLQTLGITSIGQIAQLVEQRTENPSPYSNISDLAQKTMHTNAYEALECIRNAYKKGEKWKNLKDGILFLLRRIYT